MTRILNQPSGAQLGNVLISKMNALQNCEFIMIVAFAKNSGVLRLAPAIRSFRGRGGRVEAFVGVDLKGTSYEALVNLLHLCNNNLYVVHAEDGMRTFHPKIYVLKSDRAAWVAVGSNNLTAGGLWINWESCVLHKYNLTTTQGARGYDPIERLIAAYRNGLSGSSVRLGAIQDIDSLLAEHYVEHEATMRLARTQERKARSANRHTAVFGPGEHTPLPPLPPSSPTATTSRQTAPAIVSEDFSNEQFWFESGELTGASRNILDLSKRGRILVGSASSTRYATAAAQIMLGGVAFFDIGPDDVAVIKDMTVNFEGIDYIGCTIKYSAGNGSWRLQLKGTSANGDALSILGKQGRFQRKILVFEKIRTDYYALSVLEVALLDQIRSSSRVVAYNGNRVNPRPRFFGMF